MSILRDNNKLSVGTQETLAEYGIMREKAIEGSNTIKGPGPKYFELERSGTEYKLNFPKNVQDIDGKKLAIVGPQDNEAFDLLAPKNFSEKLNMKDEKSIRKYLRNLLDIL